MFWKNCSLDFKISSCMCFFKETENLIKLKCSAKCSLNRHYRISIINNDKTFTLYLAFVLSHTLFLCVSLFLSVPLFYVSLFLYVSLCLFLCVSLFLTGLHHISLLQATAHNSSRFLSILYDFNVICIIINNRDMRKYN